MSTDSTVDQFYVLGVGISAVNLPQTIQVMDDWIKSDKQDYIVLTGAHGIIEMQDDRELRDINNNAGLVTPDGMPEVWLGKLKGYKHIEKVYAPDIMVESYKLSPERGYRHFLYGGKEGVADKLSEVLQQDYPGIQVVGTFCPPFRPLEDHEYTELARIINEAQPDIVWCGLGCPKQERWMARMRPLLNAPVLIGVGAGFDFLTGERTWAPRWIQLSGFEWLYRMLSDPKHLWKRYARVVPRFLLLLLLEKIKLYNPNRAR
ncbi:WecB/TagA/CpsF family glycosyltransferase [Candidatus Neomarinimicrobiota bacterium]